MRSRSGRFRQPLPAAFKSRLASMVRSSIPGSLWTVDRYQIEGNTVTLTGWAAPPAEGEAAGQFLINGRPFDEVQYPLPRPDVGERLWFIPHAERSGFFCRAALRDEDFLQDRPLELTFVSRITGRPYDEWKSIYLNPREDRLPRPPLDNIARVHGQPDVDSFLAVGYSTFVKLERALQRVTGKDFNAFDRVLDWGCGCGRVSRYFGNRPGVHLTGADIDDENIRWCRANLPFGRFETLPADPPTALPGESFDLLIGISIFTHLNRVNQHKWLAELNRLAAPGAILLMSIHGATSVGFARSLTLLLRLRVSGGILDGGWDPSLRSVVANKAYYRTTYHTEEYIRRVWSRYFQVRDILPGYIGNNQDLVVLQKRN